MRCIKTTFGNLRAGDRFKISPNDSTIFQKRDGYDYRCINDYSEVYIDLDWSSDTERRSNVKRFSDVPLGTKFYCPGLKGPGTYMKIHSGLKISGKPINCMCMETQEALHMFDHSWVIVV